MSFWFLEFKVRPVRSWEASMLCMIAWACEGDRPESSLRREGLCSRRVLIWSCEILALPSLEVEPVRADVILERLDFFFFLEAVGSEGRAPASSLCSTCSVPDSLSDSRSTSTCSGASTGCDSAMVGNRVQILVSRLVACGRPKILHGEEVSRFVR